jgi:hypothetical protein
MIVIERVERASGLQVGADVVEWTGPAVAEPDAPILRLAFARGSELAASLVAAPGTGDANTFGTLFRQIPAPPAFDALSAGHRVAVIDSVVSRQ